MMTHDGYNVAYDLMGKMELYLPNSVETHEQAEEQLEKFRTRYMRGNSGKRLFNGKGTFPFRNPRIVKIIEE